MIEENEEAREAAGETPPTAGPPQEGKAGGAGPPPADDVVAVPAAELETLRQRADERDRFFRELQRAVADFDNFQKRIRRDLPARESERLRSFVRDLLPFVDDLDRLKGTLSGDGLPLEETRRVVELVRDKMSQVLSKWKIEPIAARGLPFDPAVHEALRQEPTEEHPPGAIVEQVRAGYTMDGNVLRPAQVVVAQGRAEEDAAAKEPAGGEAAAAGDGATEQE